MDTTETREIIRSLGELKSETAATLSVLATKVDGINRRLDTSNGRIAQNEKAIQELRIQESEMLLRLGMLQVEDQGRHEERRRVRVAMVERLLWLVSAVAMAIIVRYFNL